MSKYVSRLLLPLFVLFQGQVGVAAETLRISISDWPPYVDSAAREQGLAIEIVRTALARVGYRMAIVSQPWSRTLEGAQIGVYDALAAAWYSEARAARFLFSKPYLSNEIKFIKRKGDPFQYRDLNDLKGKVIGIVKDYAYDESFDRATGLTRFVNNHVIENLLLLLQGEVDVSLDDERVLRYEIDKYLSGSRDRFEILPKGLARKGLHFAVSREHPRHREIIKAFDGAIAKMRQDGTHSAILARYVW